MNPDAMQFLKVVRSLLSGNESAEEIQRIVAAAGRSAGLSDEVLQEAISQLVKSDAPSPVITQPVSETTVTNPLAPAIPHLVVDWGSEPQIGWHACPEFHLVCPRGYHSTPAVTVSVDSHLDQPTSTPIRPTMEEPGYWTFPVRFSLTTHGVDCRPGHYLIDVSLRFRGLEPGAPRFFRTRIRLNVTPPSPSHEKTLEIDGDGYSIVNLQGRDLRSCLRDFHRVVLRGGERAVINLQEGLNAVSSGENQDTGQSFSPEPDVVRHEYRLKIDHEREQNTPRMSAHVSQRQRTDAACLILPNGRRVLLLARTFVSLGRERTNDIVTRFLPRCETNDQLSTSISRQHARIELTARGLQVSDLGSSSGTSMNGACLDKPTTLTARTHAEISLATVSKVSTPFRLGVQLFPPANSPSDTASPEADAELLDTLDAHEPALWSLARSSGIDAVRIERLNIPDEDEAYVLCFRQLILGNSDQSAVRISHAGLRSEHARIIHADGSFWLQNLAPIGTTKVDDSLLQRLELVPLVAGMRLTLGDVALQFVEWQQAHL